VSYFFIGRKLQNICSPQSIIEYAFQKIIRYGKTIQRLISKALEAQAAFSGQLKNFLYAPSAKRLKRRPLLATS
jgi:hypothetical protein